MCGLAGIVSGAGVDVDLLTAMGNRLVHRGPDGSGVLVHSMTDGTRVGFDGRPPQAMPHAVAGFVHRRLKILDLGDTAAQPMCDGGVALVYNGEIYNYRALRRELEEAGFSFASSGDTEVVLKAYRAWGADCFRRFQGMWALAILDGPNRRVVLSRDRFGIKPLYYARVEGALVFASEIKALREDPRIGRTPNDRTVARYLGLGVLDDGPETFFAGVYRVPAGHWGEVSLEAPGRSPDFHRYWALPGDRFSGSEDTAVETFRDLFRDSVAGHLLSDVPSGSCLSGGIDSSAIVCSAAGFRGRDESLNHTWKSFGYVAEDEALSEAEFMTMAAEAGGSDLERITVSGADFDRALGDILAAHDEPVRTASACAQWLVFKRASESGVRVMLDGQGADETLGGYMGYLLTMARSAAASGRWVAFAGLSREYQRETGEAPVSLAGALADIVLPAFVRRRLMSPDGTAAAVMSGDLARLAGYETEADLAPRHDLGRTLAADLQSRILPALLRYEDINAMAHSVEARVPFLDHRLVEFAFALPDRLRINGSVGKYVLRQAMAGTVPDAIRARTDKIGFRQPPGWTFAHAGDHRAVLVPSATEHEQRWFDDKEVARLFHPDGPEAARESALWRTLNLKYWARAL